MAWTGPIRACRADELDRLAEIERDASLAFATVGLDLPDPPAVTSRDLLEGARQVGLLFVATDERDRPVGFVACQADEGGLYLGEIDVERAWQRRGVGRALVGHALTEARRRGLRSAMLTTDRLVPFNAPFYASLGFRIVEGAERPALLARVLASEIANGLDPGRRVAMVLRLEP